MAYINVRLDECMGYGFSGGGEYKTTVTYMDNGREQRNADWQYPRHRYSIQYNNISTARRDAVVAAIHACRGQLHALRMKDWNDYTATNEVIAPVAGTTTPVQLIKTYTIGGEDTARLIQAPVAGTVTVYRNGIAVAGTLDAATGLFTPDANWEATGTFTWTGEFDVWVRFASDYNPFAISNLDTHTADIELVEVRR